MDSSRSEASQQPNSLRRKLFRGVPAGLGVLMAVQAKTALGAATCISPSAKMSSNLSHHLHDSTTCSGGRSPGFWKVPQHFDNWAQVSTQPARPTFNKMVSVCASGMQNLTVANIVAPGKLLSSVFLGAPVNTVNRTPTIGVGIWQVLAFPNDPVFGSGGQLLRHLSAAWLNAGYPWQGGADYPLTQQQVVDIWNALISPGYFCPGGGTSCAGTSRWYASDVITYISGMYDVGGVGVDNPDLCGT